MTDERKDKLKKAEPVRYAAPTVIVPKPIPREVRFPRRPPPGVKPLGKCCCCPAVIYRGDSHQETASGLRCVKCETKI